MAMDSFFIHITSWIQAKMFLSYLMAPCTTWPQPNTFPYIVMMSCGIVLQSTKYSSWPPGWIEGDVISGREIT